MLSTQQRKLVVDTLEVVVETNIDSYHNEVMSMEECYEETKEVVEVIQALEPGWVSPVKCKWVDFMWEVNGEE